MLKLLKKERKLTASILSYLFIASGLLTFCPGYPILLGAFFVCLGLFQTFQAAREANDIVYTALLPVAKSDVVKSRYVFCVFIELCYFLLAAAVTLIRMTVLADAPAYRANALMNANPAFLGYALVILGCFNAIFVGGFFQTAYAFARPFVTFIIVSFLLTGLGETLWHIPGLGALNAFGFDHAGVQAGSLLAGAALFALLTWLSMGKAIRDFEQIDL